MQGKLVLTGLQSKSARDDIKQKLLSGPNGEYFRQNDNDLQKMIDQKMVGLEEQLSTADRDSITNYELRQVLSAAGASEQQGQQGTALSSGDLQQPQRPAGLPAWNEAGGTMDETLLSGWVGGVNVTDEDVTPIEAARDATAALVYHTFDSFTAGLTTLLAQGVASGVDKGIEALGGDAWFRENMVDAMRDPRSDAGRAAAYGGQVAGLVAGTFISSGAIAGLKALQISGKGIKATKTLKVLQSIDKAKGESKLISGILRSAEKTASKGGTKAIAKEATRLLAAGGDDVAKEINRFPGMMDAIKLAQKDTKITKTVNAAPEVGIKTLEWVNKNLSLHSLGQRFGKLSINAKAASGTGIKRVIGSTGRGLSGTELGVLGKAGSKEAAKGVSSELSKIFGVTDDVVGKMIKKSSDKAVEATIATGSKAQAGAWGTVKNLKKELTASMSNIFRTDLAKQLMKAHPELGPKEIRRMVSIAGDDWIKAFSKDGADVSKLITRWSDKFTGRFGSNVAHMTQRAANHAAGLVSMAATHRLTGAITHPGDYGYEEEEWSSASGTVKNLLNATENMFLGHGFHKEEGEGWLRRAYFHGILNDATIGAGFGLLGGALPLSRLEIFKKLRVQPGFARKNVMGTDTLHSILAGISKTNATGTERILAGEKIADKLFYGMDSANSRLFGKSGAFGKAMKALFSKGAEGGPRRTRRFGAALKQHGGIDFDKMAKEDPAALSELLRFMSASMGSGTRQSASKLLQGTSGLQLGVWANAIDRATGAEKVKIAAEIAKKHAANFIPVAEKMAEMRKVYFSDLGRRGMLGLWTGLVTDTQQHFLYGATEGMNYSDGSSLFKPDIERGLESAGQMSTLGRMVNDPSMRSVADVMVHYGLAYSATKEPYFSMLDASHYGAGFGVESQNFALRLQGINEARDVARLWGVYDKELAYDPTQHEKLTPAEYINNDSVPAAVDATNKAVGDIFKRAIEKTVKVDGKTTEELIEMAIENPKLLDEVNNVMIKEMGGEAYDPSGPKGDLHKEEVNGFTDWVRLLRTAKFREDEVSGLLLSKDSITLDTDATTLGELSDAAKFSMVQRLKKELSAQRLIAPGDSFIFKDVRHNVFRRSYRQAVLELADSIDSSVPQALDDGREVYGARNSDDVIQTDKYNYVKFIDSKNDRPEDVSRLAKESYRANMGLLHVDTLSKSVRIEGSIADAKTVDIATKEGAAAYEILMNNVDAVQSLAKEHIGKNHKDYIHDMDTESGYSSIHSLIYEQSAIGSARKFMTDIFTYNHDLGESGHKTVSVTMDKIIGKANSGSSSLHESPIIRGKDAGGRQIWKMVALPSGAGMKRAFKKQYPNALSGDIDSMVAEMRGFWEIMSRRNDVRFMPGGAKSKYKEGDASQLVKWWSNKFAIELDSGLKTQKKTMRDLLVNTLGVHLNVPGYSSTVANQIREEQLPFGRIPDRVSAFNNHFQNQGIIQLTKDGIVMKDPTMFTGSEKETTYIEYINNLLYDEGLPDRYALTEQGMLGKFKRIGAIDGVVKTTEADASAEITNIVGHDRNLEEAAMGYVRMVDAYERGDVEAIQEALGNIKTSTRTRTEIGQIQHTLRSMMYSLGKGREDYFAFDKAKKALERNGLTFINGKHGKVKIKISPSANLGKARRDVGEILRQLNVKRGEAGFAEDKVLMGLGDFEAAVDARSSRNLEIESTKDLFDVYGLSSHGKENVLTEVRNLVEEGKYTQSELHNKLDTILMSNSLSIIDPGLSPRLTSKLALIGDAQLSRWINEKVFSESEARKELLYDESTRQDRKMINVVIERIRNLRNVKHNSKTKNNAELAKINLIREATSTRNVYVISPSAMIDGNTKVSGVVGNMVRSERTAITRMADALGSEHNETTIIMPTGATIEGESPLTKEGATNPRYNKKLMNTSYTIDGEQRDDFITFRTEGINEPAMVGSRDFKENGTDKYLLSMAGKIDKFTKNRPDAFVLKGFVSDIIKAADVIRNSDGGAFSIGEKLIISEGLTKLSNVHTFGLESLAEVNDSAGWQSLANKYATKTNNPSSRTTSSEHVSRVLADSRFIPTDLIAEVLHTNSENVNRAEFAKNGKVKVAHVESIDILKLLPEDRAKELGITELDDGAIIASRAEIDLLHTLHGVQGDASTGKFSVIMSGPDGVERLYKGLIVDSPKLTALRKELGVQFLTTSSTGKMPKNIPAVEFSHKGTSIDYAEAGLALQNGRWNEVKVNTNNGIIDVPLSSFEFHNISSVENNRTSQKFTEYMYRGPDSKAEANAFLDRVFNAALDKHINILSGAATAEELSNFFERSLGIDPGIAQESGLYEWVSSGGTLEWSPGMGINAITNWANGMGVSRAEKAARASHLVVSGVLDGNEAYRGIEYGSTVIDNASSFVLAFKDYSADKEGSANNAIDHNIKFFGSKGIKLNKSEVAGFKNDSYRFGEFDIGKQLDLNELPKTGENLLLDSIRSSLKNSLGRAQSEATAHAAKFLEAAGLSGSAKVTAERRLAALMYNYMQAGLSGGKAEVASKTPHKRFVPAEEKALAELNKYIIALGKKAIESGDTSGLPDSWEIENDIMSGENGIYAGQGIGRLSGREALRAELASRKITNGAVRNALDFFLGKYDHEARPHLGRDQFDGPNFSSNKGLATVSVGMVAGAKTYPSKDFAASKLDYVLGYDSKKSDAFMGREKAALMDRDFDGDQTMAHNPIGMNSIADGWAYGNAKQPADTKLSVYEQRRKIGPPAMESDQWFSGKSSRKLAENAVVLEKAKGTTQKLSNALAFLADGFGVNLTQGGKSVVVGPKRSTHSRLTADIDFLQMQDNNVQAVIDAASKGTNMTYKEMRDLFVKEVIMHDPNGWLNSITGDAELTNLIRGQEKKILETMLDFAEKVGDVNGYTSRQQRKTITDNLLLAALVDSPNASNNLNTLFGVMLRNNGVKIPKGRELRLLTPENSENMTFASLRRINKLNKKVYEKYTNENATFESELTSDALRLIDPTIDFANSYPGKNQTRMSTNFERMAMRILTHAEFNKPDANGVFDNSPTKSPYEKVQAIFNGEQRKHVLMPDQIVQMRSTAVAQASIGTAARLFADPHSYTFTGKARAQHARKIIDTIEGFAKKAITGNAKDKWTWDAVQKASDEAVRTFYEKWDKDGDGIYHATYALLSTGPLGKDRGTIAVGGKALPIHRNMQNQLLRSVMGYLAKNHQDAILTYELLNSAYSKGDGAALSALEQIISDGASSHYLGASSTGEFTATYNLPIAGKDIDRFKGKGSLVEGESINSEIDGITVGGRIPKWVGAATGILRMYSRNALVMNPQDFTQRINGLRTAEFKQTIGDALGGADNSLFKETSTRLDSQGLDRSPYTSEVYYSEMKKARRAKEDIFNEKVTKSVNNEIGKPQVQASLRSKMQGRFNNKSWEALVAEKKSSLREKFEREFDDMRPLSEDMATAADRATVAHTRRMLRHLRAGDNPSALGAGFGYSEGRKASYGSLTKQQEQLRDQIRVSTGEDADPKETIHINKGLAKIDNIVRYDPWIQSILSMSQGGSKPEVAFRGWVQQQYNININREPLKEQDVFQILKHLEHMKYGEKHYNKTILAAGGETTGVVDKAAAWLYSNALPRQKAENSPHFEHLFETSNIVRSQMKRHRSQSLSLLVNLEKSIKDNFPAGHNDLKSIMSRISEIQNRLSLAKHAGASTEDLTSIERLYASLREGSDPIAGQTGATLMAMADMFDGVARYGQTDGGAGFSPIYQIEIGADRNGREITIPKRGKNGQRLVDRTKTVDKIIGMLQSRDLATGKGTAERAIANNMIDYFDYQAEITAEGLQEARQVIRRLAEKQSGIKDVAEKTKLFKRIDDMIDEIQSGNIYFPANRIGLQFALSTAIAEQGEQIGTNMNFFDIDPAGQASFNTDRFMSNLEAKLKDKAKHSVRLKDFNMVGVMAGHAAEGIDFLQTQKMWNAMLDVNNGLEKLIILSGSKEDRLKNIEYANSVRLMLEQHASKMQASPHQSSISRLGRMVLAGITASVLSVFSPITSIVNHVGGHTMLAAKTGVRDARTPREARWSPDEFNAVAGKEFVDFENRDQYDPYSSDWNEWAQYLQPKVREQLGLAAKDRLETAEKVVGFTANKLLYLMGKVETPLRQKAWRAGAARVWDQISSQKQEFTNLSVDTYRRFGIDPESVVGKKATEKSIDIAFRRYRERASSAAGHKLIVETQFLYDKLNRSDLDLNTATAFLTKLVHYTRNIQAIGQYMVHDKFAEIQAGDHMGLSPNKQISNAWSPTTWQSQQEYKFNPDTAFSTIFGLGILLQALGGDDDAPVPLQFAERVNPIGIPAIDMTRDLVRYAGTHGNKLNGLVNSGYLDEQDVINYRNRIGWGSGLPQYFMGPTGKELPQAIGFALVKAGLDDGTLGEDMSELVRATTGINVNRSSMEYKYGTDATTNIINLLLYQTAPGAPRIYNKITGTATAFKRMQDNPGQPDAQMEFLKTVQNNLWRPGPYRYLPIKKQPRYNLD